MVQEQNEPGSNLPPSDDVVVTLAEGMPLDPCRDPHLALLLGLPSVDPEAFAAAMPFAAEHFAIKIPITCDPSRPFFGEPFVFPITCDPSRPFFAERFLISIPTRTVPRTQPPPWRHRADAAPTTAAPVRSAGRSQARRRSAGGVIAFPARTPRLHTPRRSRPGRAARASLADGGSSESDPPRPRAAVSAPRNPFRTLDLRALASRCAALREIRAGHGLRAVSRASGVLARTLRWLLQERGLWAEGAAQDAAQVAAEGSTPPAATGVATTEPLAPGRAGERG
jgi:hypothetical protein